MTEDVLIRIEGRTGRLSLNRPQALHALDLPMCEAMLAALICWRDDPAVEAVLLDHAVGRGFCAGGDIRQIAEAGSALGRSFFATEYRLNQTLFDFPKPVIVVMDGVVMGGGAGLALPASIRIATERTLFAMPETGIGLLPDVGGSWHLSRLPGETGTWLGMTGARLGAADCLALGIASHGVAADAIEGLKAALVQNPGEAAARLAAHAADPGPPTLDRGSIDVHFAHDAIEAILDSLLAEGSDWSRRQHRILLARCPTALKATLRQLRMGRDMTEFSQALALEYRLCTRLADRPDFREGVRAAVIDKDQSPAWRPAALADVDELDALFAPLATGEWSPA